MKKYIPSFFFFFFLSIFLLTTGCKKKKAAVPVKKSAPAAKTVTPAPAEKTAPVTRYYVVTGSFLNPDNVQRYEGMMRGEGFTPLQLPGDSGFQRVAVFAFDDEGEARQKLQEVRSSSPQHRDAWLLITRE